MFGLGHWELIIIAFIVLLIFGVGKLPELGSGLGKAIKGFKSAVSEPEKIESGNKAEAEKKEETEKEEAEKKEA